MQHDFYIESPAQVPWHFYDRADILIGEAPGMVARITRERAGRFNVLLTTPGARILAEGKREGTAKAVAFVLEAGDSWACHCAQKMINLDRISADGPSSTVSFSQARENPASERLPLGQRAKYYRKRFKGRQP